MLRVVKWLLGLWLFAAVAAGGPSLALANEDATAHAGEHETHGPPSPLAVDPDLAIYTGVLFLLLMLVLSKFAWGPIAHALEKREAGIAANLDGAAQKHEEAKLLLAEYEKKLAGTAAEIKALLDDAARNAETVKAKILGEAKAGADAERERALRDISSATDSAIKELADHSATLAVELAGKIVSAKMNKDDHTRLIQDAISRLPKSSLN